MVSKTTNIIIILLLVFITFLRLLLQRYTKEMRKTKKPPDSHPTVFSQIESVLLLLSSSAVSSNSVSSDSVNSCAIHNDRV